MLLKEDIAALTAAVEAAIVPNTTRRTVQGPGRIFGLAGLDGGMPDCSFDDSLLIKSANRALASALGQDEASFTWTSLQLNRNTTATPHFDSGTIGTSAIVLLGEFDGGALTVEGMPDLVAKGEVRLFDGGRQRHSSSGFTGVRHSLVWHTRANAGDLPPAVAAYLESLNFRLRPHLFSMHIRVLYCFSGPHRRSSLAVALFLLRSAHFPHVGIEIVEIDTLNDPVSHDLLDADRQEDFVAAILSGHFHFNLFAPPCNSWTRAVWANHSGPRPLRSAEYPLGFPWLSIANRAKAEVGNTLIHFAARCLEASRTARIRGLFSHAILEFPENLGSAELGQPASPFQLGVVQRLWAGDQAYITFAFFQCQLGAVSSKPTRLVTSLVGLAKEGFIGPPSLDPRGRYKGPLPKTCGHTHNRTVNGDDASKALLSSMAAYPEGMNLWLARGMLEAAAGPSAGVAGSARAPEVAPSRPAAPTRACIREVLELNPDQDIYIGRGDAQRGIPPSRLQNPWKIGAHGSRAEVITRFKEFAESSADIRLGVRNLMGKRLVCHCLPGEPCHGDVLIEMAVKEHAQLAAGVVTHGSPAPPPYAPEAVAEMQKVGTGEPFTVNRKGALRHIVDGAGVCSPGKWPPGSRIDSSKGLSLELRTVLEHGVRGWATAVGSDPRRLVMEVAAPSRPTPLPDAAFLQNLRGEVVSILTRRGHAPQREGAPGKINFGLLAAMASAFEDPDAAYPLVVAEGVPVGITTDEGANPLPRAPAIYEAKTKWALPELGSEEWLSEQARWATNYPSARVVAATLAKQFEEEIGEDCMLRMSLGEARRRWGDKLTIAALGAIEKTEGTFRVIYDASNTVKLTTGSVFGTSAACPSGRTSAATSRTSPRPRGSALAWRLTYAVLTGKSRSGRRTGATSRVASTTSRNTKRGTATRSS